MKSEAIEKCFRREQYRRELLGESRTGKMNSSSTKDGHGGGFLCAKRSRKHKTNKPATKGGGKVTHLGAWDTHQCSQPSTMQNGSVINNDSGDMCVDDRGEEDEILTYDEVALHLSRTGRKRPIVLVGPPNVGCLDLRARLMEADKERFAGVVPHTSRQRRGHEQDGMHYCFVTKQKFQEDVEAGKFVEWGEYQKHFYGTSFEAIQRVVDRGKTCILTLKAQSLKNLRNSNLMPYVVFISPPSFERLKMNRLKQRSGNIPKDEDLKTIIQEGKQTEEMYGHLFDKVIVNIDLERSFQELRNIIHRLETEPHWIPSHWLKFDQGGSVGR